MNAQQPENPRGGVDQQATAKPAVQPINPFFLSTLVYGQNSLDERTPDVQDSEDEPEIIWSDWIKEEYLVDDDTSDNPTAQSSNQTTQGAIQAIQSDNQTIQDAQATAEIPFHHEVPSSQPPAAPVRRRLPTPNYESPDQHQATQTLRLDALQRGGPPPAWNPNNVPNEPRRLPSPVIGRPITPADILQGRYPICVSTWPKNYRSSAGNPTYVSGEGSNPPRGSSEFRRM